MVTSNSTNQIFTSNPFGNLGKLSGCDGINKNYTNNCNCYLGYYQDILSIDCLLCSVAITGCNSCSNSSTCLVCKQ